MCGILRISTNKITSLEEYVSIVYSQIVIYIYIYDYIDHKPLKPQNNEKFDQPTHPYRHSILSISRASPTRRFANIVAVSWDLPWMKTSGTPGVPISTEKFGDRNRLGG